MYSQRVLGRTLPVDVDHLCQRTGSGTTARRALDRLFVLVSSHSTFRFGQLTDKGTFTGSLWVSLLISANIAILDLFDLTSAWSMPGRPIYQFHRRLCHPVHGHPS